MAAGSHDVYGGWESKTCHICQCRIIKTRNTALERYGHQFHYDHRTRTATSWHIACKRKHRKEAT